MPWQEFHTSINNHNRVDSIVVNHNYINYPSSAPTDIPHSQRTYPPASEPQVQPEGSPPAPHPFQPDVQPPTWEEYKQLRSSTGFLLYPVGWHVNPASYLCNVDAWTHFSHLYMETVGFALLCPALLCFVLQGTSRHTLRNAYFSYVLIQAVKATNL